MQEIFHFNNPNFGDIRSVVIGSNPMFAGIDVAAALGYKNPSKAVMVHVHDLDKTQLFISRDAQNGNLGTRTTFISESGIYALVLSSHLPEAQMFKHWLTAEVIPQIRKTGSYTIPSATRLLPEHQRKIDFYDAVMGSNDSISVSQLAKIITQNGHRIGSVTLYRFLRNNHYLGSVGESYNLPLQRSMNLGIFSIRQSIIRPDEVSVRFRLSTRVTPHGINYFLNLFKANANL